jgi:hypothetical protein
MQCLFCINSTRGADVIDHLRASTLSSSARQLTSFENKRKEFPWNWLYCTLHNNFRTNSTFLVKVAMIFAHSRFYLTTLKHPHPISLKIMRCESIKILRNHALMIIHYRSICMHKGLVHHALIYILRRPRIKTEMYANAPPPQLARDIYSWGQEMQICGRVAKSCRAKGLAGDDLARLCFFFIMLCFHTRGVIIKCAAACVLLKYHEDRETTRSKQVKVTARGSEQKRLLLN